MTDERGDKCLASKLAQMLRDGFTVHFEPFKTYVIVLAVRHGKSCQILGPADDAMVEMLTQLERMLS